MPLSEHEQRMLDEIERALYQDDPKFATSVNVTRLRRRRPILAGLAFLLGLVMLVVGVIASQSLLALGVIVSVVGFLVMVGSVGLFVFGQPGGGRAATRSPENTKAAGSNTLSDRMEERFRRRFDEQG
ncbi:DUF3040 domain-containing protein [Nakamurella sp. YIM 132087]|uniref:DUF3040 domain-containing protein n=1 Tax=Nakamurella alba TaxID=2665158 RepID=A0A7K1FTM6_9ACTN|nr:DUF3040 domain-containing protein [Nakamurella alba]MTD16523.1 DUF3040 domain-containing protein [Nakamurella alba]